MHGVVNLPDSKDYFRHLSGAMVWYKQWFGTRYYALLYGKHDTADAAVWVDAIVDHWQLPSGSHVLDLGCGRGRHAGCLAARGMKVTGMDISAESIAEARMSVPGASFVEQDMREDLGNGSFDAVCCLFTSLGYFEQKLDDERVIRNVAAALKPGGRFVLDFMNTPLVLHELVVEEEQEQENVRFSISRTVEQGVLIKRIIVRDAGDTHYFEERVETLDPQELEQMAVRAGLEIEARTDGPAFAPYDRERSQRFVLWARKPNA